MVSKDSECDAQADVTLAHIYTCCALLLGPSVLVRLQPCRVQIGSLVQRSWTTVALSRITILKHTCHALAELRNVLVAVAESRPYISPSAGIDADASSRSTRAAARRRYATEADDLGAHTRPCRRRCGSLTSNGSTGVATSKAELPPLARILCHFRAGDSLGDATSLLMLLPCASGSPEEQLGRGARRARIHLRMPSGSVIGAAPATVPEAAAPPPSGDLQSAAVAEAPLEAAPEHATPEQTPRERLPPPTRSRRRQRSPSPAHRLRARPLRARRYTDEDADSGGSDDDDGVALALQRSLRETPRGLRRQRRASTEERLQDAEPEPEARRPRRAAAVAAARNWQQTTSPAAADDAPEHADAAPGAPRQLRSSSRAPSAAPQGPDVGGAIEVPAPSVGAAAAAEPGPLASAMPQIDEGVAAWPEDVKRRKRSGRTRVTADGHADERPLRPVPASTELRDDHRPETGPSGDAGPVAGSTVSEVQATAQVPPQVQAAHEPADEAVSQRATDAGGPEHASTLPACDQPTAWPSAKADMHEAAPESQEEGSRHSASQDGLHGPVVDIAGRVVSPTQVRATQPPVLPPASHALQTASAGSADGPQAATLRSWYGAPAKAPGQQSQLALPGTASMANGAVDPPETEPADASAAASGMKPALLSNGSGLSPGARTETTAEGRAPSPAEHPGQETVADITASSSGAMLPSAAEVDPAQIADHPHAEDRNEPEQSLNDMAAPRIDNHGQPRQPLRLKIKLDPASGL